jgi:uncharacterized protein
VTVASILWRRRDVPGHDACRLERTQDGWRLEGAATFLHEGTPASLAYDVACDTTWRTTEGSVRGWIGATTIAAVIRRTHEGQWTMNDDIVHGLDDCVDLDLGFTPATNLFQLRRIDLAEGAAADVPVAWLDVAARTLDVLHQRYERRSADSYAYDAPRFDYAAMLRVDEAGFVHDYPQLWRAEE